MAWRRLEDPRFGLANRISDAIAALEWREPGSLVDVRGSQEFLLACDFAGAHSEAQYEAFAFLLGAITQTGPWMQAREEVRDQLLNGRGEMSYKALNDARRQRALAPFLMAANLFPGNLVVVIVSKKLKRLFDNPGDRVLFPELIVAVRNWNMKSFHRLLLVATIGALLTSGLAESSQDLLWVTDQDEIAPNPTKHDHAGHVIHHCLGRYAPDLRGVLTFATTEANVDKFLLRDAVAITDLAAGCLVDAFGASKRGSERALWVSPAASLTRKAQVILDWFAQRDHTLRRLVICLDPSDDGTINLSVFRPVRVNRGQVLLLR
jgi:hypothetical protein